jgi:hypothetical protein
MERIDGKRLSLFARNWLWPIVAGGLVSVAASAAVAAEAEVTAPLVVPPAPTHLIGFPSIGVDLSAAVVLRWRRSLGATSYEVFIGTSPGGESSTPAATVIGPKATIDRLAPFTTYYLTVKAHNSQGDSAASAEAKVTTGCDVSCE